MSPKNLSKEITNKLNLCILSKDKRGQKGDKRGTFCSVRLQVKRRKPLFLLGFSAVRLYCTGVKKAENGTRTHDPFITSEVLYQLSYSSNPTNINFNRLTTDCQEHFPYVLREKEDAQQLSVMHLLQCLLFTTMSATVMIFPFVFSAFTFMMMVMITYSIWIVIQTSAQICFHLCICIATCSWE